MKYSDIFLSIFYSIKNLFIGETALKLASTTECEELLIFLGANPDELNNAGNYILEYISQLKSYSKIHPPLQKMRGQWWPVHKNEQGGVDKKGGFYEFGALFPLKYTIHSNLSDLGY